MLLGLAFSENNANTTATDNNNYEPSAMSFTTETGMAPEDTSGETGQILPPKK